MGEGRSEERLRGDETAGMGLWPHQLLIEPSGGGRRRRVVISHLRWCG